MILSKLLKGVEIYKVIGGQNIKINNLSQNSKKTAKNTLFFCINGTKTDGKLYLNEATKNGAVAVILCKSEIETIEKLAKNSINVTFVFVDDVRKSMAIISANFYGNPQSKMKIIGITGTNGKTSCSYIIAGLLNSLQKKVGVIGTSGVFVCGKKYDAHMTTPDSIELFEIFAKMVNSNVEFCIMEVSAHAIYFEKIFGINFAVKALTNIQSDHLDFFGTQKNYENTKKKFFEKYDFAVVNNDEMSRKIITRQRECKMLSFGYSNSDLEILEEHCELGKTEFLLKYNNKTFVVKTRLTGKFNILNVALSIGVLICLGFEIENVIPKVSDIKSLAGRFDIVQKNNNFNVIVDYAHTTKGLENLLVTTKEVSNNKNIIVFGCPGERDTEKRFEMGKVAAEFCDEIFLTSDNPASENALRIMFEIAEGIKSKNSKILLFLIENRKKAIKKAINSAKKQKKCNVLIVGKGVENYQIVGDKLLSYSDYDVINGLLKK